MKVDVVKNKLEKTIQTTHSTAAGKPIEIIDKYKRADEALGRPPTKERKEIALKKTYTILQEDIDRLNECRKRARDARMLRNNSEFIRAGIKALLALPKEQFADILFSIPQLTRGKPV